MDQGLEISVVDKEDDHWNCKDPGDDAFIAVALPEAAMRQRENCDGKQKENKKGYSPEWQNLPQVFHRPPLI